MRILKAAFVAGTAVLAAGVTTGALASHGKAGLWSVDMTIAGQDTSKMPPDVISVMKARGLFPNASGGFTLRRCMTAAEVADDSKMIDLSANKDCQIVDKKSTQTSVSAGLICKGQLNGTGHVAVNYDSDKHYTAEVLIEAAAPNSPPTRQDQKFVGRWISDSCATKP